jgi:hypothetical protein
MNCEPRIYRETQYFCGAGVSPAFLQRAQSRKIAGETPAPRHTILVHRRSPEIPNT